MTIVLAVLRTLPFVVLSTLSIWAAGRAPRGRKPFELDFTISPELVAHTLTKVPHFKYISILFLLAVVATGTKRLSLALALTMLVGVAWELAQTTVIGHNARVADLAPNVVAGVGCFIVVWFLRFVMLSPKRRRILSEEAAQQSDAADEVRAGHGNRGPRS